MGDLGDAESFETMLQRPVASAGDDRADTKDTMAATLVFDVTRLIDRARRPTPSGIDRVQLEYLLHVAARYPSVAYVTWTGGELRRVPRWLVRGLSDHLVRAWCGAPPLRSDAGWVERTRFARAGLAAAATRAATRRRRIAEAIVDLASRWSSASRRLAPGRWLRAERRGDRRLVYLNVSHKRLDGLVEVRRRFGEDATRTVVMIHDLMPILHREFFPPALCSEFERGLLAVVAGADAVIVNSEQTGDELCRWARDRGMPVPRLAPISLAAFEVAAAEPAAEPLAEQPYFVFLGSVEERKNIRFLIELWRQLATAMPDPPRLYLVGKDAGGARSLRDQPQLREVIEVREALSDRDVDPLMRGARALLFPSRAEGFGLPVVEAIARNTPVLCSDLASLREAGRGVPELLALDDVEAWKGAIIDYATDGPRRAAQLQRMAAADFPTWADHFRQMDALIDQVARQTRDG